MDLGCLRSSFVKVCFAIQKRCVRLLFGKQFSFDHVGYYETCARVRTYDQHMASKNYCLEHTKPLFKEYKILCLTNLHTLHTFMELFKIFKHHTPFSIFNLFSPSLRDNKSLLRLPIVHLSMSKENFVFKAATLWNNLIGKLLNKCLPGNNGIVIPGSTRDSDISASTKIIKTKLKDFLLKYQCSGERSQWVHSNFFN